MKYYHILIFSVFFAVACKKDSIPTYEGTTGISFYTEGSDSLNYSFALQPTAKLRDTIYLDMRLVGTASQNARKIRLKAADGSTARAGIDYILAEATLPPGKIFLQYPVILLNSPEMQNTAFKLNLVVDPASEIPAGATGTTAYNSVNFNKLRLTITNQLLKPAYWDNISFLFGDFSVTKFQFMIRATGQTDFNYETLGLGGLLRIQVQIKNALDAYERLNGPLIDEFGNRVEF